MRMISLILTIMLTFVLCGVPGIAEPAGTDIPVVALRVRDYGDIYLELYPDIAPITVDNFLKLVDSGFYNGLTFHRIISGFMAQGGCPLGNGTGNSGQTIRGEFSSNGVDNPLRHERGVLSMARSSNPDSASCQFFIMHDNKTHLDGNYAAFGRVIAGMDTVDSICLNAHVTDSNGTVPKEDQPVITEAVRVSRAEAERAAMQEAENGAAGGVFKDPATGLSFPMPDGWSLKEQAGGNSIFSDGTEELSLSTMDIWRRLGKNMQEQYVANGYGRDQLTTEVFARSAFANSMGTTEDGMTEETVNGVLWYAAAPEKNGQIIQHRICVIRGTFILFAGCEGAAVQAMKTFMTTLTVE